MVDTHFSSSSDMELKELLSSLRRLDLLQIVKRFKIDKVHKSSPKAAMIDEICASPTVVNDRLIQGKLRAIGEYFLSGGRHTLTLFVVDAALPPSEDSSLESRFGESGDVFTFDGSSFRFAKLRNFHFQNASYPIAVFEYPGRKREVVDFLNGPITYTPLGNAECVVRSLHGKTVLDVRCPSGEALKFASCISSAVWGKDGRNRPRYTPEQVTLSHELAMKLKKRFIARSFQIKVGDSDEIDANGLLHPRTTEQTSRDHDLTEKRSNLRIPDSAEDMAHGLAFDDVFDGIVFNEGCRVYLNYPMHQVYFRKTASFGAYNKVIEAIMEHGNG